MTEMLIQDDDDNATGLNGGRRSRGSSALSATSIQRKLPRPADDATASDGDTSSSDVDAQEDTDGPTEDTAPGETSNAKDGGDDGDDCKEEDEDGQEDDADQDEEGDAAADQEVLDMATAMSKANNSWTPTQGPG